MTGGSWLADVRSVPVMQVAKALDLTIGKDGKSFACPACGREQRSSEQREKQGQRDPRGACAVVADGQGWICYTNGHDGCGAKGDGVQLVAFATTGKPWSPGDQAATERIREWYDRQGWLTAPPAPAVAQPPPSEAPRPLREEVADLWDRCLPVTLDWDVAEWLSMRGLAPERLAELDAVRALPADVTGLPRWAAFRGQPWNRSGHRLIVRAWEPDPDRPGFLRLASLHARNVRKDVAPGDKAAWAAAGAGSAAGLVMACGPDPIAEGFGTLHVTIAEGVPDWLTWLQRPIAMRGAVLGCWSGSATADLAALVPLGWTSTLRTHRDAAGDKYAARWAELLRRRACTVYRAAEERDDNARNMTGDLPDDPRSGAEEWTADGTAVESPQIEFPVMIYPERGAPKPSKTHEENTRALLEAYGVEIRHNLMRHRPELTIPGFTPANERAQNTSIAWVVTKAERHGLAEKQTIQHLQVLASEYHPVYEWMRARAWDGKDRIAELFNTIELTPESNRDLSWMLLRRWLVSCAAAVMPEMRSRFSPQGVLTFQGQQGAGKTRWVESLAPRGSGWIGVGMTLDPHDRDSVQQLTRHWIAELGEVDATFKRSDVASLKAFVTKASDTYRSAYDRREEDIPRRTMLFASVNRKDFLVDETGNRRWWAMAILSCLWNHGIDLQQLWAQVMLVARAGEPWWLTTAEQAALAESNAKHEMTDPIVEDLWQVWEAAPEWADVRVPISTIWSSLPAGGMRQRTRAESNRLADALRRRGLELPTQTHGVAVYRIRKRQAPPTGRSYDLPVEN